MLPKPQNRLEVLLNKIATNAMNDLPIPQSRLELLVSALITGDIDNLPGPQSRSEAILHCILLDTECNINPQSRVELFLKSIITLDIEGLPTPMSRLEWYLDYIVRNGCLEKYEYYPFQIWSYLNVNNTPKARMKFKSMKGNTLVNLADFKQSQALSDRVRCEKNNGKYIQGNITVWNMSSRAISIDIHNLDTDTYKSFHIISNGSCKVINIGYNEKIGAMIGLFQNGWTSSDLDIFKKSVIILEGDHTQNQPNVYIEGMKSFGESENKIEVLSDNNLQGELKQSSKSTLMYRNSSNELVPVPILRGKWENGKFLWGDEVLEHEDGKLYYHKRCEEYLLNGTEPWMLFPGDSTNPRSFYYSLLPGHKFSFDFMVDNKPMVKSKTQDGCWRFDSTDIKIAISDNQSKFATIPDFQQHIKEKNLRVILQLPYEEVYQCELSEQLYSFDGETNIFINGGAVVGETVIEVGTKLGPIVATLKQETKIVTDGLKGVLAGNMQELAYQLYPEDFNKDNTVEMKPIEPVE